MGDSVSSVKLDSRGRAELALCAAAYDADVVALSKEHGLPVSVLHGLAKSLRQRAYRLFSDEGRYAAKEKAAIAIEAFTCRVNNVSKSAVLAAKYDIAVKDIEKWLSVLRGGASLLFESNATKSKSLRKSATKPQSHFAQVASATSWAGMAKTATSSATPAGLLDNSIVKASEAAMNAHYREIITELSNDVASLKDAIRGSQEPSVAPYETSQIDLKSQMLFKWLVKYLESHKVEEVNMDILLRCCPKPLRKKAALRPVLEDLRKKGLISVSKHPIKIDTRTKRAVNRISVSVKTEVAASLAPVVASDSVFESEVVNKTPRVTLRQWLRERITALLSSLRTTGHSQDEIAPVKMTCRDLNYQSPTGDKATRWPKRTLPTELATMLVGASYAQARKILSKHGYVSLREITGGYSATASLKRKALVKISPSNWYTLCSDCKAPQPIRLPLKKSRNQFWLRSDVEEFAKDYVRGKHTVKGAK